MQNKVQLITYIDRLASGGIKALDALLSGPLRDLFGGVHLLPFFDPIDGADAGFDPADHTQVDSRLGSWQDIKALAEHIDVIADVIVNHVSINSPQFRDFLLRGSASAYQGLFLTRDKVFPNGASANELAAIYRPRPGTPFTVIRLQNGEEHLFWTTFTPQQLDIDVTHTQGRAYLDRILHTLSSSGVAMVRLDAIGYAIKKPGTSCFMLPETFDFIADFAQRARSLNMEVLVEVHSYYRKQIEIARKVDWVYDFALPPLVLHAFTFGTSKYLQEWIRIRPTNALTVLDTHDGIGIVDIGADHSDPQRLPGLVPERELDQLVEVIHRNSNQGSRLATGAAASNLDLYQVNCTFYDALARNDMHYLLARAIQFLLPGVPQVYYVGLLAGVNDLELLQRTGVGRDINRRYYNEDEILVALQRPVVRALCNLIRLRNTHPAFNGEFKSIAESDTELHLRWNAGVDFVELRINLAAMQNPKAHRLTYSRGAVVEVFDCSLGAAGEYAVEDTVYCFDSKYNRL